MALRNAEYQNASALAQVWPSPQLQERRPASEEEKQFINTFRRSIYAFGHEKFAEFAASITEFGFPAKVEFYADPTAGIDALILRMVPQEGVLWTDVSVKDECCFGLRAIHGSRVVEHVACIDPSKGVQGELTTVCCLHSITPAVLDKELTSFLREVLEVRARIRGPRL